MWISAQSRPEEVFKDHMTFFSFDNPLWALNLSTCNRENKCACVLTIFFFIIRYCSNGGKQRIKMLGTPDKCHYFHL